MSISPSVELLHNNIAGIEYWSEKILGHKIRKCIDLRTLKDSVSMIPCPTLFLVTEELPKD